MSEVYVVDQNGDIVVSEDFVDETTVQVSSDSQVMVPDELSAPALEPSATPETLFSPEEILVPYSGSDAVLLAGEDLAAVSDPVFDLDNMVIYKARVTGYSEECTILIPPDEADYLTVENGVIYNWSDHSILCPFFPGEVSDRQSVDTLYLTFLGRASSSFANSTYRNGSAQYVTSYSYSTGMNLQSTNTYVAVSDVQQEGYTYNFWVMIILLVVALLMGVNALFRLSKRGVY